MSDWNGIPQNPERDGWHWLRTSFHFTYPGYIGPQNEIFKWDYKYNRWWQLAFDTPWKPEEIVKHYLYLHPVAPPDLRGRVKAEPDDGWLPIESAPWRDDCLGLSSLGQQMPWGWESWTGHCVRGAWFFRHVDGSCTDFNGPPPTHYRPTTSAKSTTLGMIDGDLGND